MSVRVRVTAQFMPEDKRMHVTQFTGDPPELTSEEFIDRSSGVDYVEFTLAEGVSLMIDEVPRT